MLSFRESYCVQSNFLIICVIPSQKQKAKKKVVLKNFFTLKKETAEGICGNVMQKKCVNLSQRH